MDSGLACVAALAGFYRIPADPKNLQRELAFSDVAASITDLVRAAKLVGLRARVVTARNARRLRSIPVPAIVQLKDGSFTVYSGVLPSGDHRLVDPVTRLERILGDGEILDELSPELLLVQRRRGGEDADAGAFGFRWFLPSLWRYRKPLAHVVLASLFVQLFALVTPLFFQVVVDKVLVHKGYETLYVLVAGLVALGLFDVALQQLRGYVLTHTTNRIDVELGRRLFAHLVRLPISYFETRPAGQTVARLRELETVRTFLTGQGLFSAMDLVFTVIFVAVLFAYSWQIALVVGASIPVYLGISALVRPLLRDRVNEKFNRGAESQQFLVESVIGVQTLKSAAIEPLLQSQWDEKLAAYVRSGFDTTNVAMTGQNAIQYVAKLTSAVLLLVGAFEVMEGRMSVGALIACNLIAGQVVQPVLRLSQFFQDFQQVSVAMERLGDILNAPVERRGNAGTSLPPPRGEIEFRNVAFRYGPSQPEILKGVSLHIKAGEVIGIVGPSGSGKSTLTKLVQMFYQPASGQILVDKADTSQVDPTWLRRNIGVVLQENVLFNRSIHDNIALANPGMTRAAVMHVAQLAGADEFIDKLPHGYDTVVEERGANLSGGQRQRIAIARALATNPSILILDEATSALDYESERVIHGNMRRIVQGRTVIIIAHRLAAVRHCDRIVGMSDGRIVEVGPHDDLVRTPDSLYGRLWALQTAQAMGQAA